MDFYIMSKDTICAKWQSGKLEEKMRRCSLCILKGWEM